MSICSFIYGGVRSEFKGIVVNDIRRSVLPPINPRTIDVPDRDGIYFFKTDFKQRIIEVDITLIETSKEALRSRVENISIYLDPRNGVQSLVFDDELDRTYYAVLSNDTNLPQLKAWGKTTLVFLVPDGFSYSTLPVIQNINAAQDAIFSRSSDAYESDGTLVGPNIPRYENGVFGTAIQVEEGTTNMLTANQSSVETNTVGFTATTGTTIGQEFTYAHVGKAGLVIVTQGQVVEEGVELTFVAAAAATTYTYSVYLIGSGKVKLNIEEQTGVGVFITDTDSAEITLSFDEFVRYSLTITSSGTTGRLVPKIITSVQNFAQVYADAFQVEAKAYATSWHLGGASRGDELLKIATDTRLFGQQGTLDFFFKKTGRAGDFGGMFDWGAFTAGSTKDRICILHGASIGSGEDDIQFNIVNSSQTQSKTITVSLTTDLVVGREYYLACRWYLDGTTGGQMIMTLADLVTNEEFKTIASATINPPTMTAFSTAFLGSLTGGNYWSNCTYDSFRMSIVIRSSSDITDSWEFRRPLIKDPKASVKYSFAETLAGTLVTNLGTAPADPTITLTFISATTDPIITQFKAGSTEVQALQVTGSFVSGDQVLINSDTRKVTYNSAVINDQVTLASEFPVLTGDHFYTFAPTTSTDITVAYTPRWL
jgi:predicted phage tail component-like protein